jgi:hypothetical protein
MLADFLVVERDAQPEGLLDGPDAFLDDLDDVDLGVRLGHDRVAVLVAGDGAVGLGHDMGSDVQARHAAVVALGVVALQVVEVEIDVETRAIVGQVDTVAVADGAAGRGEARLGRGLRVGAHDGRGGIGDLQIPEPGQEHAHGGADQQRQQSQSPARRAAVVIQHNGAA